MSDEYPLFFARFYDLIYRHLRDGVDSQFYLSRIRETEGKILEIGVGTGRLFLDALQRGADIYGIDISPGMLEVLNSKLNTAQKKRVTLQNMIDFTTENRFSLIIAPFRVFMHLIDKKGQLTALDNICNHLTPGGEFIFDVFVPDLKMLISGLHDITDFNEEYEPGCRVKRTINTQPDLMQQIINLSFLIEWNDNQSAYSREWKTQMRYFFRYELEHLIERSKFYDYHILGDFNGNGLDNNSKEFIVVCKKE